MDDTPRIIVEGLKPYDGDYPLDVGRAFTTRDWNIIRRVADYLPYTIDAGLRGGDPSLYVALAVVAMVRAQKIERDDAIKVADLLADEPFDSTGDKGLSIRLVFPEVEPSPLALTPPPDEPSESERHTTTDKTSRSGQSSRTSSGPSETTPGSIGTTESEQHVTLMRTGSET